MKQPGPILIKIPDPCHEHWDQMQPADKGRFCNSCQKTVIDFMPLTDRDIARIFRENAGKPICGRFFQEQLNRPLEAGIKPVRSGFFVQKAAAVLLCLHSLVNDVKAQVRKPSYSEINAAKDKGVSTKTKNQTITGWVLDYNSREPVAGVTISIKGEQKAITGRAGRFVINIPDSLRESIITLDAAYQDSQRKTASEIFHPETVDLHNMKPGEEIMIYRYPMEALPDVKVEGYYHIDRSRHQLSGPAIQINAVSPPGRKHRFWTKIKSWLKN